MFKLFSKKQVEAIKEDYKDGTKLLKEAKLLLLSMQMDSLLVIAKLEQDRQKVNETLDKLHKCIREYDNLLNEIYGL